MHEFNQSLRYDKRMYAADIAGSIAYAKALAALDAHERQLSIEIAKGSPGGFTEIVRRSGDRRSSRRSGGSGSTVWSAGMSKGEGEDD
ncbi:hypothetical protein NUW54_g11523 [Trametes sanguinea]|uniref:Uncharacterized protein n=1 Tax=Trametes sanguinea TaxID=158606 RepID=A0ACC1NBN0_9APHY|nr:hypothetical protein NUW54_g11523 [Trametes sanguinea]